MAELGYTPNHAARALRRGTSESIGVICHDIARTGESRTVQGLVAAARTEGYSVTLVDLASTEPTEYAAAALRLHRQGADGLVIISAEAATPETLSLPPGLPVVVADSRFAGHLPSVATDEVSASRRATDYLLDLGHPTVHHLRGPLTSGPAEQRRSGWESALRARGAAVPAPLVGAWTMASGYRLGPEIVASGASAVFCANDEMAAGLLRGLSEAGRRVPEDVSVVGFDDIPMAAYLTPPLTTIRQDFATTGRILLGLLLRQVRAGERLDPGARLLPADLVVRASTAPPRPSSANPTD